MIGFRQNVKYPKIIIKELIPKAYFKLSIKAPLLLIPENANTIKEMLNPQIKSVNKTSSKSLEESPG